MSPREIMLAQFARGVDAEQFARHVAQRLLRVALGLLPGEPAELVDARRSLEEIEPPAAVTRPWPLRVIAGPSVPARPLNRPGRWTLPSPRR